MKEIITKLISGRFIFTVVCAVLLYRGVVLDKFPPDQVLPIIKDVVIFYFIVKHSLDKESK